MKSRKKIKKIVFYCIFFCFTLYFRQNINSNIEQNPIEDALSALGTGHENKGFITLSLQDVHTLITKKNKIYTTVIYSFAFTAAITLYWLTINSLSSLSKIQKSFIVVALSISLLLLRELNKALLSRYIKTIYKRSKWTFLYYNYKEFWNNLQPTENNWFMVSKDYILQKVYKYSAIDYIWAVLFAADIYPENTTRTQIYLDILNNRFSDYKEHIVSSINNDHDYCAVDIAPLFLLNHFNNDINKITNTISFVKLLKTGKYTIITYENLNNFKDYPHKKNGFTIINSQIDELKEFCNNKSNSQKDIATLTTFNYHIESR